MCECVIPAEARCVWDLAMQADMAGLPRLHTWDPGMHAACGTFLGRQAWRTLLGSTWGIQAEEWCAWDLARLHACDLLGRCVSRSGEVCALGEGGGGPGMAVPARGRNQTIYMCVQVAERCAAVTRRSILPHPGRRAGLHCEAAHQAGGRE